MVNHCWLSILYSFSDYSSTKPKSWTHLFPFWKMTQKKSVYLNCLTDSRQKSPNTRIKIFIIRVLKAINDANSNSILFYGNCFIVAPSPMIFKDFHCLGKVLCCISTPCLFHAPKPYMTAGIAPAPVAK
jgi:hypothetical protein